jgi:hypothetical protein
MEPNSRLLPALAAIGLLAGASSLADAIAQEPAPAAASTPAMLAEVRHTFTLHGQPIPPEIFRDFGDGNIADSGSIWVTVDIEAATGSNLYFDTIKKEHGWVSQAKTNQSPNGSEETAYKYVGATGNGLLVAIASYNGGGSGNFYALHILDLAAGQGFDSDGKIYRRINLTVVRSVILGDRWNGDVTIAKNSLRIRTKRLGPVDSGAPSVQTIEAVRPKTLL